MGRVDPKTTAQAGGFSYPVFGVAFSPDGQTLATATGEPWGFGPGSVQLWNTGTGKLLATFEQPSSVNPNGTTTVYGLTVSSDGVLLATINGDGSVGLWDIATKMKRAILHGHTGSGGSVAFSPNGALLASSPAGDFNDTGGDARLWNVKTAQQLAVLEGHTGPVKSVAFSPDGHLVATASSDKTVHLWDVITGRTAAVLKGSANCVSSVTFNADGTILASAGWDGRVRLWGVQQQTGMRFRPPT